MLKNPEYNILNDKERNKQQFKSIFREMGKHFAVLFLLLVLVEYIKKDYGIKNSRT